MKLTDQQILESYLKTDLFFANFNMNEVEKNQYIKTIKDSYGFQHYLAQYRLSEAINDVLNEIKKLPLLKKIYGLFLFKRLMKTNLNN